MEFFKKVPNIDFMEIRKWAAGFSIVICLTSILSFFIFGLNLGLDFTGGTQLELTFNHAINNNEVRERLKSAGFHEVEVQSFGNARSVVVTLSASVITATTDLEKQAQQDALVKNVLKALPEAEFNRADFIGAKVSSELTYKGILAVIIAMLATMVYIGFRFEFKLAVGAVVAALHDPILILGVFSVFQIPFDLTSLAAVLTILGYSLHNTVVVFDRIRENFRKVRQGSPVTIVNDSINQTLSRTTISSGLTLSVVMVLYLVGGASIHAFSLALLIGILIGTYSSIYVSGTLAVALGLNRSDLLVTVKKDY